MLRALLVFAGLAALVLLGGCQRKGKVVIGVVPKSVNTIFWITVQAGAMAAGKDLDVEIEWNGPAVEAEFSRQIQILDSMITRRVDGIALAVGDRKALVQTVERAAAAGVPLVVFDSGVDTDKYVTYIATDNYAGGQMAAHTLAKLVGGRGAVAMMRNSPGSYSTMDRERGFLDVLGKEYPGMRVVAEQFGVADRAKSMTAMENILSAHPNLDGLFASAEPCSVGAALALKSRGLGGKVKFVAFDSSDAMIEDLKGGVMHAMVVQDPFRMGYEAVTTVVEKLRGKTPPRQIDLPATVVDLSNLDQPEIRKLVFPDIKPYVGG